MELDLHNLGWSRFGGHMLYCCGSVAFLMGEGLLCGSSLFSLGSMVPAVIVSIGLRSFCLQFASCDVTLRLC